MMPSLPQTLKMVALTAAFFACGEATGGGTHAKPLSSPAASSNPWMFADFSEPTPLSADSLQSFTLTERRRYGEMDGLGALDVVSQVAVSDSFVIALLFRSCEFVVFERSSARAIRRFGHCGQGPGDFWDMSQGAITMRGDTLVVIDKYGRRLRMLSVKGDVYRTSTIDSTMLAPRTGLARVDLLTDSTGLFAVNLPSPQRRATTAVAVIPTSSFLRHLNFARRAVTDTGVRDGPGVAANVSNAIQTPILCPVGANTNAQSVVVLNRWEPQLVVLPIDDLTRTRSNVRLPASIPTHPAHPDSLGRFRPLGLAEIACGDTVALVSRRPANATNAVPEFAELYAYSVASGRIRFARFDSTRGAVLGRLAAGFGDRFFMVHNSRYDYPVITEFEFSSETTRQSAGTGGKKK